MALSKQKAKELLRDIGLRATAPRLAVLRTLHAADSPLSHTQVLAALGETDWDPATIYRNLVKLTDVGLAEIASRVEGIDRYAIAAPGTEHTHEHAHFVCEDCGRVACLPDQVTASITAEGPWEDSIRGATVQLRGACPDCLQSQRRS